jgi:CemA family
MEGSLFSRIRGLMQRAERWYLTTPDRALDDAYDAALMIRSIENEHFGGQLISPGTSSLGSEAYAYFEQELNKHLKEIRLRLSEFRLSRSTLNVTNPKASQRLKTVNPGDYTPDGSSRIAAPNQERETILLEKLKLIDDILKRYRVQRLSQKAIDLIAIETGNELDLASNLVASEIAQQNGQVANTDKLSRLETISDKTGVLPRSILGTINRLKRDLDPDADVEVLQDFRAKRARTKIAMRYILILIAIPLAAQLTIRNLALSDRLMPGHWISSHFQTSRASFHPNSVFLNGEMTEQALRELQAFEEQLKFENLLAEVLGREPQSIEAQEFQVQEKVKAIARDFSQRSANAIKNWLADIGGVAVFIFILTRGRRELEIVKSFMDEVVYGLSDSAKAFIIILFTDIFVGFHSPHGWEVMLEGLAEHLGIPANRQFIFLFIATFPVILDTIFKYWIFRYLNRISPSSVATYKEMNE